MHYDKSPLNFEDQASLLLNRGMVADRDALLEKLKSVSYYRLSAYWYPYKNPDDTFKPDTNFQTIWAQYRFYRGVSGSVRKQIANDTAIPVKVFQSWLRSLNSLRNICAHHARVWNRTFGDKPKLPMTKEWGELSGQSNDTVFVFLTMLKYLMRIIAPQSNWANRLKVLLEKYPDIPLLYMGFPEGWEESSIWKV